jgi:ferredoxin
MTRKKKILRWTIRIALLALAIFFVLGGPLPLWAGRFLPALSPLASFASALGQRAWYVGLFWALPALAVLALAVAKGRFFCNWICPLGTLCAASAKINVKRKRLLRRPVAGYIFWAIIGSALVGYPLFLFLDPLATSSRTAIVFKDGYYLAALVPGLLLPTILIAGLFQPMLWCSHICPLGHLNGFGLRLRRSPSRTFRRDRREILVGLGIGLPLGLLAPKIAPASKTDPILPPGALPPDKFASVCTRCGACIESCPTGILRYNLSAERGLIQLFQPEMNANFGGCEEFCRNCTQVCPSGAIRPLGEDPKRYRQIGIAEVTKSACLAWTDGEHCMVCDEYCPYLAIDTEEKKYIVKNEAGEEEELIIPCPVVDPEKCRGCGICQYNCPAIRDGRAIIVKGIPEQVDMPEVPLY